MKNILAITIAALLFRDVVKAQQCTCTSSPEVVLVKGDLGVQATEYRTYHSGLCGINFSRDGNLMVNGGFAPNLGWDTGGDGCDDYVYRIGKSGDFIIQRGQYFTGTETELAEVHYSTRIVNDTTLPYFMGINNDCTLAIYQGTTRSFNPVPVWTNYKEFLSGGMTLGKAEYVLDENRTTIMRLDPNNGDLVVYEGSDVSGVGQELWNAGATAPTKDFYLDVSLEGTLTLWGINDDGSEDAYYTKNLNVGSDASTFFVVYDAIADDLIAYVSGRIIIPDPIGTVETVLLQDDRYTSNEPAMSFHNDTCQVDLMANGALRVMKNGLEMWTSGAALPSFGPRSTAYFLNLQLQGNLVVYQGFPGNPGSRVWAANTQQATNGDYFLGIDSECILGIYEGAPSDRGNIVWSNIVTNWLSGDNLYRSIIVRYPELNVFTVVHPVNGKLLTFQGQDWTTVSASTMEPLYEYPISSNVPREATEFLARGTIENGELELRYYVEPTVVKTYGTLLLPGSQNLDCYEIIPSADDYSPTYKECD